jgi:hypothetical protein
MKKLIFALTLMGLLGGHAPLTASQPVPDAAGYIVNAKISFFILILN